MRSDFFVYFMLKSNFILIGVPDMLSRLWKNTKTVSEQLKDAVDRSDWNLIYDLVRAYPSECLKYQDSEGDTLLHKIGQSEYKLDAYHVFTALLALNPNLDVKNNYGKTSLQYIAAHHNSAYGDAYADYLQVRTGHAAQGPSNLVSTAVYYSKYRMAQRLVEHGYKVDSESLIQAVFEGEYDFVRTAILRDRSLLSVVSSDGSDLLKYAALSPVENSMTLSFLLAQGIMDNNRSSYDIALEAALDKNTPSAAYLVKLFAPKTPSKNPNVYGLHDLDLVKAHYLNVQNEVKLNPVLSSAEKTKVSAQIDELIQLAEQVKYNSSARSKTGKLLAEYAMEFKDYKLLEIALVAATGQTQELYKTLSLPVKSSFNGNGTPLFNEIVLNDLKDFVHTDNKDCLGIRTVLSVADASNQVASLETLLSLANSNGDKLFDCILKVIEPVQNTDWSDTPFYEFIREAKQAKANFEYKQSEVSSDQLSLSL